MISFNTQNSLNHFFNTMAKARKSIGTVEIVFKDGRTFWFNVKDEPTNDWVIYLNEKINQSHAVASANNNVQVTNNMSVPATGTPATQPYVLDKRKVGCAIVLLIVAIIVCYFLFGDSGPRSESQFKYYAVTLVEKQYNESAKLVCSDQKVVETDGKGRSLVTMKVEAQRVLEELEVTEYASIVLYIQEDGKYCHYNPNYAVNIEDTEADRTKLLSVQKVMCNWGNDYESDGY